MHAERFTLSMSGKRMTDGIDGAAAAFGVSFLVLVPPLFSSGLCRPEETSNLQPRGIPASARPPKGWPCSIRR